ncbi:phosphatase PAP2 family protein [Candidatus Woesearchaeota archaeon]|nr:phosphatase PAP2 family protein [Candidatus Woesearchaeota archaeon]
MKKVNRIVIFVVSILMYILSYNFDRQISSFFQESQFAFFDFIFSIITNFGFVLVVMLFIPSIILYRKNKDSIYLLWLAFIVSFILNFIVKLVVHRIRPVDTFTYPFLNIINYSFPSTHSIVVFSLLPILIKKLPKYRYYSISFAFLVAFTRVYLGFHFLSDVIFGALAGYFIGDYFLELKDKGKLWKI